MLLKLFVALGMFSEELYKQQISSMHPKTLNAGLDVLM